MPLFQLLLFGFVAPPLLKPHVVVSQKDGSWATGSPPVIPSVCLSNVPGVSDLSPRDGRL